MDFRARTAGRGRGEGDDTGVGAEKGAGEEGFLDDLTEGWTWPQGGQACFLVNGEKGPMAKVKGAMLEGPGPSGTL